MKRETLMKVVYVIVITGLLFTFIEGVVLRWNFRAF